MTWADDIRSAEAAERSHAQSREHADASRREEQLAALRPNLDVVAREFAVGASDLGVRPNFRRGLRSGWAVVIDSDEPETIRGDPAGYKKVPLQIYPDGAWKFVSGKGDAGLPKGRVPSTRYVDIDELRQDLKSQLGFLRRQSRPR